jgi:SAM-dependent methyltransferase
MSSYAALARYYDVLTRDVDYQQFADYYEELFRRKEIRVRTILDLACGTGTLTCLLAGRGYDMIGADASEDMLSVAYNKAGQSRNKPMFLCQPMESLDLYGTVDAIVCSMDGVNYVRPELLETVFRRVMLFLEPGGLFVFDIQPPERLMRQDGQVFLDETSDVFCAWRASFDREKETLHYGMDLFALEGRKWSRFNEEHVEYAHAPQRLEALLLGAGFADVCLYGDMTHSPPAEDGARVFITAQKPQQDYTKGS